MIYDNLPTSLPWYRRIELQDRFKSNVFFDPRICQLAPYNGLLPFIFFKNQTSELPQNWYVKCMGDARVEEYSAGYEDEIVADLTPYIDQLIYGSYAAGDYFMFPFENNASHPLDTSLPDGLPPGIYYMEMVFTQGFYGDGIDGKYVSELFRVPDDRFSWNIDIQRNYPVIKWWHNTDLKPIHYLGDGSFYNLLYLDTIVTASEPEIEVEGEKDGNNEFIPTFQKAVIKYRLSAVVPDFIKVALFMMLLHDNKYLSMDRGFRQGVLKNPDVNATLTNDGAFSIVELLFEQDTLITSTACESELEPVTPFTTPGHPALTTTYCDASGAVTAHMDSFPANVYAELQGRAGAGPYLTFVPYISRADMLAGWSGNIPPSSGVDEFKVVFRTFEFTTGESAASTPTVSC